MATTGGEACDVRGARDEVVVGGSQPRGGEGGGEKGRQHGEDSLWCRSWLHMSAASVNPNQPDSRDTCATLYNQHLNLRLHELNWYKLLSGEQLAHA